MNAYQIKITLMESKPPIWRRLIVPENLTFSQFIVILNVAMGWMGYHLAGFRFPKRKLYVAEPDEDWGLVAPAEGKSYPANETYLKDLLREKEKFVYTYDYGDNWQHQLVVEKTLPDYAESYAQVTEFQGDCPPEDCGGIGVYQAVVSGDKKFLADMFDDEEIDFSDDMIPYDLKEVNRILKVNLKIKGAKVDTRLSGDIYADLQKGKNGIFMQNAAANAKKALSTVEKSSGDAGDKIWTTREILELDVKDVLQRLAKAKGISVQKSDRKAVLVDKVAAVMADPQVIESYLVMISEDEKACLERAGSTGRLPYADINNLHVTMLANYLGLDGDDIIMIPAEILDVYKALSQSPEYEEKRRKYSWLLRCVEMCNFLYGITPADVFLKLAEKEKSISLNREDIWSEFNDFPPDITLLIIKNDHLIAPLMDDKIDDLLQIQGEMPFYIPDRNIIAQGPSAFFDNSPAAKALRSVLENFFDTDEKTAVEELVLSICYALSQDMPESSVHSLLATLGLRENSKVYRDIMEIIKTVSHYLPHVIFRGAIPLELKTEANKAKNNKVVSISSKRAKKKK